jgi:tetratricopeptide (TPR) repeat protein
MRLQLIGTTELRDSAGRDCTPRSAKARAILALLARAPERRRTRRWLESRLWSDRGAEQASGSLRQALMEIRRALGPDADLLFTDREAVSFASLRTDLDDDPTAAARALAQGREFLEGLDVADDEFEDWLRAERQRLAGGTERSTTGGFSLTPTPLLVSARDLPGGSAGFVALALADAIGQLVTEFAEVELYTDGPDGVTELSLPTRGLLLTVQGALLGGALQVLVTLAVRPARQILWSRRAVLPLEAADLAQAGDFPQIVYQAAEAVFSAIAALPRRGNEEVLVDAAIGQAVRDMFSFEAERLRRADRKLAEVTSATGLPRAWAWRAYLRQIMAVERTEPDWGRLRLEADEFSRRSLEVPGASPLILALGSQVRAMLDSDHDAGSAMAREALLQSPFNAFGHAAMSGALLRAGRAEEALAAARQGSAVAGRSAFAFWWEALAGLSAMQLGRLDEAAAHYQAAHIRAPNFRAPLRHLIVLNMVAGRTEKAEQLMAALRRIEPDFTLARVREDRSYPAATLRSGPLLLKALSMM